MESIVVKDYKELNNLLFGMERIYDEVRIVDPTRSMILVVKDNMLVDSRECFEVWHRSSKCINCISKRCIAKNKRLEKFETNGNDPYFVVTIPLSIENTEYKGKLALEILTVTDALADDYSMKGGASEEIETLNKKVFFDSLTGIFNRRFYDEKIIGLDKGVIQSHVINLVMLDVNKFKKVNDLNGHDFGDYALKNIARIFKESVSDNDIVIRYGGDEFVIIIQNQPIEFAEEKIKEIQDKIVSFFDIKDHKNIHIDAGIVHMDDCKTKADMVALFKEADCKMYAAKALANKKC